MKTIRKWFLRILLLAIIVIQFFPVDRSTGPEDLDPSKSFAAMTNAPEDVLAVIESACYDCHSYKTKWPWYGYVAPVSWLLADHVDHGRGHMNFFEWGTYPPSEREELLEEIAEEVEESKMPLEGYVMLHSEADLSDEQKATLIGFVRGLE